MNLTGTCTNTSDRSCSARRLARGTCRWSVIGGTIQGTNGHGLVPTTSNGTLNGVTLNSDTSLANGTP